MKPGTTLQTERLLIRHWMYDNDDREIFYQIMSNEIGRRYYPSRLTRKRADEVLEQMISGQSAGELSWSVACRKDNGQQLGFTGLRDVTFDVSFAPTVEIGWQYLPVHWGNGYATEAAAELLRHAFEDLNLPEIVAFAIEENTGSTAVMNRVGMKHRPDETFIHPNVPDTHPHLKRHVLWRTTKDEWKEQNF